MLDCLRHKVEESSVRRSTLSSVSELALLMDLSLLILVLDFCILLGEGGWMWRCNAEGGSPGCWQIRATNLCARCRLCLQRNTASSYVLLQLASRTADASSPYFHSDYTLMLSSKQPMDKCLRHQDLLHG